VRGPPLKDKKPIGLGGPAPPSIQDTRGAHRGKKVRGKVEDRKKERGPRAGGPIGHMVGPPDLSQPPPPIVHHQTGSVAPDHHPVGGQKKPHKVWGRRKHFDLFIRRRKEIICDDAENIPKIKFFS